MSHFLRRETAYGLRDHPFRHRRGTSVPLLLLLARTYVHLAIDEASDSYFKVHNFHRFTGLVNSSVAYPSIGSTYLYKFINFASILKSRHVDNNCRSNKLYAFKIYWVYIYIYRDRYKDFCNDIYHFYREECFLVSKISFKDELRAICLDRVLTFHYSKHSFTG